jgi:hypothetical protein
LAEQKRKCSADFAMPSPPAKKKKTTARQDQAEQTCADDGAGDRCCCIGSRRPFKLFRDIVEVLGSCL